MSQPAPEFSFIIVSYRVPDSLRECLCSLQAQLAPVRFEALVVDNSPGDGTAEMVRTEFPWVRLLEPGCNLGFSRAVNLAAGQARGELLAILNPDTRALPGFSQVAETTRANPRIGLLSPRVLREGGGVQSMRAGRLTVWRELMVMLSRWTRRWVEQREQAATPSLPGPVQTAMGSCLVIRRQCYLQVGPLEEEFFLFFEEFDYALRVIAAGWQVWYLPVACAVHQVGRSADQQPVQSAYHLMRSRLIFFRKHFGRWQTALIGLVTALQAIRWWLQGLVRGDRERRALAIGLLQQSLRIRPPNCRAGRLFDKTG